MADHAPAIARIERLARALWPEAVVKLTRHEFNDTWTAAIGDLRQQVRSDDGDALVLRYLYHKVRLAVRRACLGEMIERPRTQSARATKLAEDLRLRAIRLRAEADAADVSAVAAVRDAGEQRLAAEHALAALTPDRRAIWEVYEADQREGEYGDG